MPKRKKTHTQIKKEKQDRMAASLFKPGVKDMSYVTQDKRVLRQHINFINKSSYVFAGKHFNKLKVAADNDVIMSPKSFWGFWKYYAWIFERWQHLIKCCYYPNYSYYKFFGAKGIRMSEEFLDGKKFCMWCLKKGLTSRPGMYDIYLQRKDKSKSYSSDNCYIILEKTLHECKGLDLVLKQLYITKRYEENHDPSVSYMTMYTRYYVYDLDLDESLSLAYDKTDRATRIETVGFSPINFYTSVATEKDVSLSVFISRMHYSYLSGGFTIRPYDMLKPEFSVEAESAKEGRVYYKKQWDRDKKEKEGKAVPLVAQLPESTVEPLSNSDLNIYNNKPDVDVYSK
jgi:hypothetical protein